MTKREKKILKKLLDVLHDRDGKPIEEGELFQEFAKDYTHAEFKSVLAMADARGWLTGVNGEFSGQLWDINDDGKITRLKL